MLEVKAVQPGTGRPHGGSRSPRDASRPFKMWDRGISAKINVRKRSLHADDPRDHVFARSRGT